MTSITTIGLDLSNGWTANSGRPGRSHGSDQVDVSAVDKETIKRSSQRLAADPLSRDYSASFEALNQMLSNSGKKLNISVDPASGTAIFEIIDTESGNTLLRVPSVSTSHLDRALLIRSGVLLDTSQ